MNNKNTLSGLSSVELLISLSIITLLCIAAMPSLQNFRHKLEAQHTAKIIAQLLQSSKLRAYTHRQRISICPSKTGTTCDADSWSDGLLIFNDSIANRMRDPDEHIIQHVLLDLKYGQLSWRGFGVENHIIFQPENGLPRGSNGSFHYCSAQTQHSFKVVMSAVGTIRHEAVSC